MTATCRNPNSPDYGQAVRGFAVHFTHPNWKNKYSRFHKHSGKYFSLPCSGCLPYTGEEALDVMRKYKGNGFEVAAFTDSPDGGEELTIEEMEEFFQ